MDVVGGLTADFYPPHLFNLVSPALVGPRGCRVVQILRESLSCGAEHTCLLSDAGALYSCGAGKRGQLGLGHTDNSVLPQRVAGVRGGSATRCAASVSCGGYPHRRAVEGNPNPRVVAN